MLLTVPSQIGYIALGGLILGESAGLPLPGETALIAAGGLAGAGHLSLALVILVAALAAIIGDSIGYWLGRRRGRALMLRDGFAAAQRRHAVQRADEIFARYGAATVFFARWIPGVRIVAAVMAGAARMPWPRFAAANAAGAVAWASAVATLAALAGPVGSALLVAAGLALGTITLAVEWRSDQHVLPHPVSG